METRKRNIVISKSGGSARGKSLNYRISLPTPWVQQIGVTEEDKEVQISFDGKKIIIEKIKNKE